MFIWKNSQKFTFTTKQIQERISEPLLLLGDKCKLHNNSDLLYIWNTIKYNTFEYFNVTYGSDYLNC